VAGGRERKSPSLAEVFGLRCHQADRSFWRKLVSFLGPGYLVAVGYMDPGNWATSLAGGLEVRLRAAHGRASVQPDGDPVAGTVVRGSASAQDAIWRRPADDAFPAVVSRPLWLLAEIAICATDLAEVIGTAIGLNLLFGIPLEIGV